jgi:flavin-dependent dehydrogenase
MSDPGRGKDKHVPALSKKAVYSRNAQKRLSEARTKIVGMKSAIRSAKIAGHLVITRQLEDAQRAVDANLGAAEASLERLRKSGEKSWEALSIDADTAWENLSLSMNKLVAGYTEGKK